MSVFALKEKLLFSLLKNQDFVLNADAINDVHCFWQNVKGIVFEVLVSQPVDTRLPPSAFLSGPFSWAAYLSSSFSASSSSLPNRMLISPPTFITEQRGGNLWTNIALDNRTDLRCSAPFCDVLYCLARFCAEWRCFALNGAILRCLAPIRNRNCQTHGQGSFSRFPRSLMWLLSDFYG